MTNEELEKELRDAQRGLIEHFKLIANLVTQIDGLRGRIGALEINNVRCDWF